MNENQSNSSIKEVLDSVKESMQSVFHFMETDLASIRTGRADPDLIKNIVLFLYWHYLLLFFVILLGIELFFLQLHCLGRNMLIRDLIQ